MISQNNPEQPLAGEQISKKDSEVNIPQESDAERLKRERLQEINTKLFEDIDVEGIVPASPERKLRKRLRLS